MIEAIYIRTSSGEQTPELQLKSIYSIMPDQYIASLITPYLDKQSAFKDNVERDDFERLRKDIRSGKVKRLYVWAWDRIYRRRRKLIEFFQFCKMYKCEVHSYRELFAESIHKMPEPFNEAMFDFMLQMLGYIAEEESQHKSDRVKMSVNKVDGITVSHKGNKWGRKNLSKETINKVLLIKKEHPEFSIRDIVKSDDVFYYDKNNNKVKLSKSVVHKILTENLPKTS